MIIRFGYVAIAMALDKVTSSSPITFTHYQKLTKKEKLEKLLRVTKSNVDALMDILKYNVEHDVHFFRLTSKLIPLATHPEVKWDFMRYFEDDFTRIGKFIKEHDMRVSFHPDQFNVLNSTNEDVVKSTIVNMEHFHQTFEAMGLKDEIVFLHVGSGAKGKEESLNRLYHNFNNLPEHIKRRMAFENDDKVFNAHDLVEVYKKLNTPIVFDYHHHKCNATENIEALIPIIFSSWKDSSFRPKLHLSSPKTHELDRSHADYIDFKDFKGLVELVKDLNMDFDLMIEAKMKDFAMFKLIEDIKREMKCKIIDQTTIEI